MESVEKMRRLAPDQFHMLVKMHLSFLLDLETDDCDCSFVYETSAPTTPNGKNKALGFVTPRRKVMVPTSKTKGVMEGAPLTVEGVCQVFQIIEFLRRPNNLKMEGLFRKHGNLKKQQTLKERLNKGITIDLDSGEFTVHECAATLKTFLGDLCEPLLTDAYYKAHCQVSMLPGDDADEKKVQALQLLFLLIPEANYALLRDLMRLLYSVVENSDSNKMTALNLATVFATHIMCPRKLSPDCLQSKHQMFIKAVTFMIENTESLFTIPAQLLKDVDMFWKCNSEKELCQSKQMYGPTNSPVVNTIYSFVDRQKTKEASLVSTTETALAELYAQVQAMPESAQKKRLISKLNDANGYGTPSLSTRKRRKATEASSKLKNLLTPKSKSTANKNQKKEGKHHGRYNIGKEAKKFDELEATPLSSYKRQDSRGNSSMVTFNSEASPELKGASKPPKPLPPPRISSLKKPTTDEDEAMSSRELLATPRCRKPLLLNLSPMLESPAATEAVNESTTSSVIEKEADLLLSGEMNPSTSMTHFLDGGNTDDFPLKTKIVDVDEEENDNPKVLTPKARKRSLTELGGSNPLVKNTTPLRNCENVYFETDF